MPVSGSGNTRVEVLKALARRIQDRQLLLMQDRTSFIALLGILSEKEKETLKKEWPEILERGFLFQ